LGFHIRKQITGRELHLIILGKSFIALMFLFTTSLAISEINEDSLVYKIEQMQKSKWYNSINFRGYAQFRYNRLFESNPDLVCDQCDKSLGENNGFFMRRARMIFFGDVSDYVYVYIQPDFASSPDGKNNHFTQLRDLYFDVALVADKSHRFRFGQSKVPYGFENLQSSQNRLALDRNDGLNSAVSNERDIGVFYYWASAEKRKLFSELTKNNLKGSGDYGIFGLGVHNGQTANKPEKNNNLHLVSRLTYPTKLASGQVIEGSVQGYHGYFVSSLDSTTAKEFLDERIAVSFIVYPKPFGFQAEYNEGKGPEYDKELGQVRVQNLKGGYAQVNYNINRGANAYIPFLKYQFYQGGKKHETEAPSYRVKELEAGIEWQIGKSFEIVTLYAYGDRQVETSKGLSDETGSRLRLQFQVNY
jgi:hypothetical protein